MFTRREKEILALIAKGFTSDAISEHLFISTDTVKTHRKKIIKKARIQGLQFSSLLRLAIYYRNFQVMPSKCAGFQEMLGAQQAENKEMAGVLTSDNKIVILPSWGNTELTFSFSSNYLYTDLIGRPMLYFDSVHKEITVYYYQTPAAQPTALSTFDVVGIVHTHPIKDETFWNVPSPEDLENAANFPQFSHYILNQ